MTVGKLLSAPKLAHHSKLNSPEAVTLLILQDIIGYHIRYPSFYLYRIMYTKNNYIQNKSNYCTCSSDCDPLSYYCTVLPNMQAHLETIFSYIYTVTKRNTGECFGDYAVCCTKS